MFVPSLQREDGSYIGSDSLGNVDAVGQDGSKVWQQPLSGATAQYATADGGGIATTTTQCPTNIVVQTPCTPVLGNLYTLDQNGNVTSQTADTGAMYSWTNQWYLDPPQTISGLFSWPLALVGWTGGSKGNLSGTGTAVHDPPFPPLDSCHNPRLTIFNQCPGPAETAYSALRQLRQLLQAPCPNCYEFVFSRVESPLLWPLVQTEFPEWLDLTSDLYDGTKSNLPLSQLCTMGEP